MTINRTLGTCFVACARALPLAIVAACGASDDPTASVQSSACRDLARNEYVVELTGAAFGEEAGSRIHAITEVQLAEPGATGTSCRATTSTAVAGGGFEVMLTNLTDTAVYPFIGAFLYRDGDRACSPLDPTWGMTGNIGGQDHPTLITLGPSSFSVDDPLDVCSHFAIDP